MLHEVVQVSGDDFTDCSCTRDDLVTRPIAFSAGRKGLDHLRVAFCLCFKASPRAEHESDLYENEDAAETQLGNGLLKVEVVKTISHFNRRYLSAVIILYL